MHAAKGGLISEWFFPFFSNLKKECQITPLSTITVKKMLRRVIWHLFFWKFDIKWKKIWDWATFRMLIVQQDPQFCLSHLLLMVLDVTESDKCNHQSWPLRFGHARCGYFKDRKSCRTTASFDGLYWQKNSWHGIILSVLLIRGIDLTWLSSFHHCTVHQCVTG